MITPVSDDVVDQNSNRLFNRSFTILSFCALVALLILCALGSWQVQRLFWKEALLGRIESQMKQQPKDAESFSPFDVSVQGTEKDIEYLPVKVEGRFLEGQEFFYYATLNGKIGYHLYSPLQIQEKATGKDKVVFVNRGFIPDNKREQSSRPETIALHNIEIEGLLRWPDDKKPNSFIPENDVSQRLFFWRDLDLMIKLTGLYKKDVYPIFIYADKKGLGIPVGGVSRVDFPNNHLAYAITWYGLALTLIGVWLALFINRLKNED